MDCTTNYYDELFRRLSGDGVSDLLAIERVATAYLDGKPAKSAKNSKLTRKERDGLFWSSLAVRDCPPDAWGTEAMSLALARYISQEPITSDGLMLRVAAQAPATLIRAVRYSELVYKPDSLKRAELAQAGATSEAVAELCRVLDIFSLAHRERVAALEFQKSKLAGLSTFDLLIYASLFAFETLVPRDFKANAPSSNSADHSLAWDALNDLVEWKLSTASSSALKLTDNSIGVSLGQHLRPIIFESGSPNSYTASLNLQAFHALMEAQIELNEFVSRSTGAFCYNDGIRFERRDNRLEIVEVNSTVRGAWQSDGRKLERLHDYWFHRAIDTFIDQAASDPTLLSIGLRENADRNQMAWLRSLQAQLRLQEVYGVRDEVTAESCESVNLFQALLSLNLMSAFFLRDFLEAFANRLDASGDWIKALQRLTMDGLLDRLQNRLPLTWSDRASKVANITGWTVTASEPKGNTRAASAILDFWTYDMAAISERLQSKEPNLQPQLFERPVLKFGATLVQLPWVVGLQNNSSAAINNLRRLGSRRGESRDETQAIESGLAMLLETRGFRVLLNWKPPRDTDDAGEVDVIATLNQHLFVIEVKSTFLRRSQREAWLHATNTLRKAGNQLRRKVEAVSTAIATDPALRASLELNTDWLPAQTHGWIADTSIECDHQLFSGFLKISIEELLIALRDDRHLLLNTKTLFAEDDDSNQAPEITKIREASTLYPSGFNAERFVEVIETAVIWDLCAQNKRQQNL